MFKNLFYFSNINAIGGVETMFYNLVRKYKDYDICIAYKTGDKAQIERLKQYVRVIKFTGEQIKCEKAFFNYNTDIIDYVDAKKYYLIIHADYKAMHMEHSLPLYPKIDQYLGVSQHVCDVFEELSGKKVKVIYNPLVVDKPKKMLNLISTTRLTREKGRDRMIQFAAALDKAGVPYQWLVYTNDTTAIKNENVIFLPPRLDVLDRVANADYLVQLSDTEGYSYSIVEALSVGTPVIITQWPVIEEMGIENGVNGWVLPFDMSDIPVKEIYKGLPKFKYTPRQDKWGKLLAEGESQYQKDLKRKVEIVITNKYYDMQLGRVCDAGEIIKVNKVRADYIIENGFAKGVN